MPEDVARAVRAPSDRRILDWLAVLCATFLLTSQPSQPDSEPQPPPVSEATCIYTALGDVAACGTPTENDVDEAAR